jgi:peptide/nickel transport system substrate-binding protein
MVTRLTGNMACLVITLLFGVSACDSKPQQAAIAVDRSVPAYGDTYIEASIGEPNNLLPVLASDSASSAINALVYNGLIRYDKDLQWEGELAESWEVSENGLVLTFHLRKDVRWHDGEPLTSADVLFTYQMFVDPQTPTAYAESYRQVSHAETPDLYTFRVVYEKPYAPALGSWAVAIHPKHLLEGLSGDQLAKSELTRKPIGTGPYRFTSWISGEKLVLEANEDYFEGRPYLKRVVYRIIPDQSTQLLELLSGGLDFMSLNPIQYQTQTDSPAFKRRYNKYKYLAFGYTYLGYNLNRPLFQNRRVRQALSYAINKQELIEGVLLGLGQAATGPYKTDTWVYNDQVERYSYNPEKARRLLEEAGWSDADGDGILDKNGKPFSFTIVTNQGNDLRIKTGEIIQRRFKEIGVEVKLRVIEWAAFLKEFINPGNFDATILGWTGGPEPDQYNIWHSSKTGPRELNFIGFKNAEVDQLLEAGRRTFDRDERKRIYDRFQEILAEEQPYTFLYLRDALPAVASRIEGIKPAPAGITYNFIRWYVPEGEQKYDR